MTRLPGPIARLVASVAPGPQAIVGFAGQGLNFGSMLVPIVTHREQALVMLVFVSSLTSAVVYVATAGIANRYAGLRNRDEASGGIAAALMGLAIVCVALAALAAVDLVPLQAFKLQLTLAAALLLAQGLGVVTVAVIVRARLIRELYWYRLAVGSLNLPLAVIACTVLRADFWLTAAAAAAQLLSLAIPTYRLRHHAMPMLHRTWSVGVPHVFVYLRNSWAVVVATAANSIALNAAGLAVLGLGALAAPWAVVSRLAGGFVTTTIQLVAPIYEGEFGFAHRMRDEQLAVSVYTRAVRAGSAVGALTVTAAVVAMALTHAFWTLTFVQKVVVVAAAFAYWGTLLSTSLVARFLTLMGRSRRQMAWDVLRATAVLGALSALVGAPRLLALGVCILGFGAAYIELLRSALRRSPATATEARDVALSSSGQR